MNQGGKHDYSLHEFRMTDSITERITVRYIISIVAIERTFYSVKIISIFRLHGYNSIP